MRIRGIRTHDVRFPTSDELDGSDAMHPDPDYSAAYVVVETDGDLEGHGFTFTIGRGNELCVAAIEALAPRIIGLDVADLDGELGAISRSLTSDSQLRWLGPNKGVIHLAAAALINALWDLRARRAGQPLWKVLAELPARDIVELIDWRHLGDVLEPAEAIELLDRRRPGMEDREQALRQWGMRAYTTSAGWLGYTDDEVVRRCRAVVDAGFTQVKIKVGASIEDDIRRVRLVRQTVGPDIAVAVDANQRWEVAQAIEAVRALEEFDLAWVEEPTSPDDVLGHLAIAEAVAPPIATGEHCANQVMFKQFLASGAMEVCQIDACRVAGVNENLAIMLMAAKFDVPVCPHAGGVGLCELVQHLSAFDQLRLSGDRPGRVIEFADHLHDQFVHPAVIRDGRYVLPTAPGYSAEMLPSAIEQFAFPDGPVWRNR